MKKLSTELKKSYISIVFIFLIFIIFSLFQSWKYVYNLNEKQLENTMIFLKNEVVQLEENNELLKIFDKDIVKDTFKNKNQTLKDLDVFIKYKNYTYGDFSDFNYNIKELNKVIFDLDKESLILSEKLSYKDSYLEITLVKDLDDDIDILERIIETFLWVIGIAIIIVLIVSRYITKIVNKSLNRIMNLNENVSLDNLKLIKPENDFLEFENIYNSYENMLKKLDIQNQQQIEFIHSSSHELKTPLFIMSGNLELLEKYGIDDKKVFFEALNSLKTEVKDMNSLVEKLLFIARSNDIILDKEVFELSDIILENIYILKKIYKDIEINFEPQFIELNSDVQLFELLFKNILENAIKYSNLKPVDITLKDSDNYVEIKVKDRGIGMTKDEVDQIFNKFYRGDSSRNKKIGGYGLGMSIVKRVIEIIDGEIDIQSEKNVGTEIILKIKK